MIKRCKCKVSELVYLDNGKWRCGKCKGRVKIKTRKKWKRKPQTQIKKSDKLYNRKKAKRKLRKKLKEE